VLERRDERDAHRVPLDRVLKWIDLTRGRKERIEDGSLLNRPTSEWSSMVATTNSGSKVAIFADWNAAFGIADRIGLSVEIVPHLMSTNSRPIGQRGFYAYWRVGSGILVANAARYLEVK
jgi:HK97 family phage major capsid protein